MSTIERAIEELHKGFRALNKQIFDSTLPEPAILVQNQGNRTRNILGWCTLDKIWADVEKTIQKYEINITAEYLNRPVTEIMETMLHEMVHLYCQVNSIKDTSRNGSYHNKRFKAEAERVGLKVEKVPNIGWASTSPKPETIELIERLQLDPAAFKIRRFTWGEVGDDADQDETPRNKPTKRFWRCPTQECENHKIEIKAKKKKPLDVICGKCREKFVYVEIEPEEDDAA